MNKGKVIINVGKPGGDFLWAIDIFPVVLELKLISWICMGVKRIIGKIGGGVKYELNIIWGKNRVS